MMIFTPKRSKDSLVREIVRFLDLLFHTTVRNVRESSVNPIISIIFQVLTSVMLIFVFIFFIRVLGTKTIAIRGNEIQFVMCGVQLFMIHNAALGAASGAGGVRNVMTLHTHITHFMLVLAAGLASLYIQILAILIVLPVVHIIFEPIEFQSLNSFCYALFLAWASGLAIGYVLSGLQPYAPKAIGLITVLYMRANMIFSGKMMVANTIPAFMLPFFYWNPLFHTIDYARGASFINYTPRLTDINYALTLTLILIPIGMILQKNANSKVSDSWRKRQ